MARGLGAFAQGFAEGYGQMSEIEARRQAMERDKERLALEQSRAAMDKERFVLEKQQAEIAMQKSGYELAEMKRQEDNRKEQQEEMRKLAEELDAPFEADIVDTRTGKVVGSQRYRDENAIIGPLKEKGLALGIRREVGPIRDPQERIKRTAAKMHSINLKQGNITLKDLSQMEDNYRKWGGDTIEKSMNYLLTTNDEAGAKKILMDGGVKIDPNDRYMVERDPQTGEANVVVGSIGKDGKFQKRFDMTDWYFSTVSPAEAAKAKADMKKTKFEQGQENLRTDKRVKGGIEEALIRANADKSGAGGDKKIDRLSEEINNGMKIIEDSLKLSTNVTQNAAYVEKRFKAGAFAWDAYMSGKTKSVNEAIKMGWEAAGLPSVPRTAVSPPK